MNIENYKLRELEEKDNKEIERVIRACLIEFGADHDGTAWADPNLGRFSEIYNSDGNKYWVVEDSDGKIVGGVGIGDLGNADGVCELQKMYCLPQVRGLGVSHMLLETALNYAKRFYKKVYLETLENMTVAQRFYEKHGFCRIEKSLGNTGHFACDVCYIRDLDL